MKQIKCSSELPKEAWSSLVDAYNAGLRDGGKRGQWNDADKVPIPHKKSLLTWHANGWPAYMKITYIDDSGRLPVGDHEITHWMYTPKFPTNLAGQPINADRAGEQPKCTCGRDTPFVGLKHDSSCPVHQFRPSYREYGEVIAQRDKIRTAMSLAMLSMRTCLDEVDAASFTPAPQPTVKESLRSAETVKNQAGSLTAPQPTAEQMIPPLTIDPNSPYKADDPSFESFKIACDHDYNCTCLKCLDWWVDVGPDGMEPDHFGPFTTAQVEARAKERGVPFLNGDDDERE